MDHDDVFTGSILGSDEVNTNDKSDSSRELVDSPLRQAISNMNRLAKPTKLRRTSIVLQPKNHETVVEVLSSALKRYLGWTMSPTKNNQKDGKLSHKFFILRLVMKICWMK